MRITSIPLIYLHSVPLLKTTPGVNALSISWIQRCLNTSFRTSVLSGHVSELYSKTLLLLCKPTSGRQLEVTPMPQIPQGKKKGYAEYTTQVSSFSFYLHINSHSSGSMIRQTALFNPVDWAGTTPSLWQKGFIPNTVERYDSRYAWSQGQIAWLIGPSDEARHPVSPVHSAPKNNGEQLYAPYTALDWLTFDPIECVQHRSSSSSPPPKRVVRRFLRRLIGTITCNHFWKRFRIWRFAGRCAWVS